MIRITKIAHFSGHRDSIYALCKSSDGKTFYSAGADGWIVAWERGGTDIGRLVGEVPEAVYSCFLDEERRRMLVGTRKGNIYVLPLDGGSPRLVEGHIGGVFAFCLLNNGTMLSGGEDGKVYLWDNDLRQKMLWMQCGGSVRVICVHRASNLFAVGSSDHLIRVGALNEPERAVSLIGHTQSVFALTWDLEACFLYSGGRDAMLRKWNPMAGTSPLLELPAHLYHINHLSVRSQNDLMLSCSMDKTIKVWKLHTLELLKVIDHARNQAHVNSVNKVLWIDENEFISCSDDRTVQHFKLEYLNE